MIPYFSASFEWLDLGWANLLYQTSWLVATKSTKMVEQKLFGFPFQICDRSLTQRSRRWKCLAPRPKPFALNFWLMNHSIQFYVTWWCMYIFIYIYIIYFKNMCGYIYIYRYTYMDACWNFGGLCSEGTGDALHEGRDHVYLMWYWFSHVVAGWDSKQVCRAWSWYRWDASLCHNLSLISPKHPFLTT